MKLYIDKDTGKFLVSPSFKGEVTSYDMKRGDSGVIDVSFYSGGTLVEVGGSNLVKFGIKEKDKYDGEFVVFEDTWSVAASIYSGSPSFNTVELNALLNHGDADDTNDISPVECMMEVTWSEDGTNWQSTKTTTIYIANDVIKGNEGIPTSGSPIYPTAQAVTDVIADVATLETTVGTLVGSKDLEPMDTARAYEVGEAFYWTDGKNYRVTVASAIGFTPTTTPANFKAFDDGLQPILPEGAFVAGDKTKLDGTVVKTNLISDVDANYTKNTAADIASVSNVTTLDFAVRRGGIITATENTTFALSNMALNTQGTFYIKGNPSAYTFALPAGVVLLDGADMATIETMNTDHAEIVFTHDGTDPAIRVKIYTPI